MTWRIGAPRKALALVAASALLASLIVVFSPPAWGNSPTVECASSNPEWDGDYWKIQIVNGTLSTVETNVSAAISLSANGSWTNNSDDDSVFRIVLKVGASGADQVVSGMWAPGEGGTIGMPLNALGHITFCFTDGNDEDVEPEPTTTTTTTTTSASSTTTTSAGVTTTTSAGPTTTTSPSLTTTTSPSLLTTTTPSSDATTTDATAISTEVDASAEADDSALAGDPSQPSEPAGEAVVSEIVGSEADGPEGSLRDADRDTVAGLIEDWGSPPALGQESLPSNAAPGVSPSSQHWPTQVDLAILVALIAAIAVLIHRRKLDLRRLFGKTHSDKR
ncbi:hypothetical protein BH23ACT4_BH23ACT4_00840 [soil metagenome]